MKNYKNYFKKLFMTTAVILCITITSIQAFALDDYIYINLPNIPDKYLDRLIESDLTAAELENIDRIINYYDLKGYKLKCYLMSIIEPNGDYDAPDGENGEPLTAGSFAMPILHGKHRWNDERLRYKVGDKIATFEKTNEFITVYDKDEYEYKYNKIPIYIVKYDPSVINNPPYKPEGIVKAEKFFCVEDLAHCGYTISVDKKKNILKLEYNGENFSGLSEQSQVTGDVHFNDERIEIDGIGHTDNITIGSYHLLGMGHLFRKGNYAYYTLLGDVVYTDIETYLNGDLIESYNYNGEIYIDVNHFNGNGYEVTYTLRKDKIYILSNKEVKCMNNYSNKRNIAVGTPYAHFFKGDETIIINGKKINAYTCEDEVLVKANDLKNYGFKVHFSPHVKDLRIDTIE